MLGQISMGKGAESIDGGIIALNRTSSAGILNSGHRYFGLHRVQRTETTARWDKQQSAVVVRVSDIKAS
ncbi:MAG: hypothetical protein M3N91_06985 [Pseudomonadota bacterium]|nr:hypothetical protein [Pseudomonadota bacterium]